MPRRSTAHVLMVVMLLASGRLLACGWQCFHEPAAQAEASCHQESTPVTAVNGGETHACLPEVAEPRVTAAKLATDHLLVTAPLMAAVVVNRWSSASPLPGDPSILSRPLSPPAPAFSVLRI